MQLLEVISPYEKCRMGIKSKGEVTRMEKLYEIIGFITFWLAYGYFGSAIIFSIVDKIYEARREKRKAKLAKKCGIKRQKGIDEDE